MAITNLNQVRIIGRIVADAEFSYTDKRGAPLAKFSVAVNRTWTDRETNEPRSDAQYVDFKAWNEAAVKVHLHAPKGTVLRLQGELRNEKWEDRDTGQQRSRIFIHVRDARNVDILDSQGTMLDPHPDVEQEIDDAAIEAAEQALVELAEQQAAAAAAPVKIAPVVVAQPTQDPPLRPAKNRPAADSRPIRRTTRQPVAVLEEDDGLPF